MLPLRIIGAVLLGCLIAVLAWIWRHQMDVRRAILQNNAMPREASRGLVYGFLIILLVGAVMVGMYWLF